MTLQIPLLAFGLGMSDKKIRTALCPRGRERLTRLLRLIEHGRVDPTPMTTQSSPKFPLHPCGMKPTWC
jgi:isopropanol dehydrogenase (NADP+)